MCDAYWQENSPRKHINTCKLIEFPKYCFQISLIIVNVLRIHYNMISEADPGGGEQKECFLNFIP